MLANRRQHTRRSASGDIGGTNGVNGVTNNRPAIPVIDLTAFTSSSTLTSSFSLRCATASRLREVLSRSGSIGIRGHGVSELLLEEAFRFSKALFNLPYEKKMLAPHPDGTVPHRGYSGIGREQGPAMMASETKDEQRKAEMLALKDFKESYGIGHPENKIQYNIWLPEDVLPGFQKFMLSFQTDLNRLAMQIIEAFIQSLNLPEGDAETVRSLNTPRDNNIQLLHYPPVEDEAMADETLSGLGAHRDWSSFTLLFQDFQGGSGLEFHDRETDRFMPAIPMDGVLYLNIGDMFRRLSNGIYPSALHRVILPNRTDERSSISRYSILFFVVPAPEVLIEPLPSLVALTGKQVYEKV